jgi:SAM-dependent methyltransferase
MQGRLKRPPVQRFLRRPVANDMERRDTPAFGPLSARFHEAAAPSAEDPELDWYDARLPREAGPVLELMCGAGRVLVPLLVRGVHVQGVDQSAAMLALCQRRLDESRLVTTLFRQAAGRLNLPFRYAAAYCAGGSFQHLADPLAAIEALRRLRAHLVGPALLLLDLTVPVAADHPPGATPVEVRSLTLSDSSRITARSEANVNAEARRLEVRTRYERREGTRILEREDQVVTRTWHTEDEAVEMLTGAGFTDVVVGAPARVRDGERAFSVTARARR